MEGAGRGCQTIYRQIYVVNYLKQVIYLVLEGYYQPSTCRTQLYREKEEKLAKIELFCWIEVVCSEHELYMTGRQFFPPHFLSSSVFYFAT